MPDHLSQCLYVHLGPMQSPLSPVGAREEHVDLSLISLVLRPLLHTVVLCWDCSCNNNIQSVTVSLMTRLRLRGELGGEGELRGRGELEEGERGS